MHPATIRAEKQHAIPVCLAIALAVLCLTTLPRRATAQKGAGETGSAEPPVRTLFEDFLHFARLGKFVEADAYARRLLAHPDLDPVELLTIADRDSDSFETLMLMVGKTSIGESAARVLEVIQQGELELRQDISRIKANIEKLAGSPQTEYNAIGRLKESGEYAVPWMLQTLQDQSQARLHSRVLAALPKLGRSAIRPLVTALAIDNQAVKGQIIRVLGQIGYAQAVPSLRKVLLDEQAMPECKTAARDAIRAITGQNPVEGPAAAASGLFELAEQYYDERGSVAADPRLAQANVWYWNGEEGFLEAVPVPPPIFGPVMAMRCCQQALRIDPSHDASIALWLAANIRREARLGLDVESPEPGEPDEQDATRPAEFPPSLYFTRAAGARYAHLALERAVHDRDAAVALGAIAALRVVAGEASLIGREDYKQPLVRALEFPDRVVRIRAALALANALPRSPFAGSQWVIPILADALQAGGAERFVVADPDSENLNRVADELRGGGAEIIAEANFYQAMDRMRLEWGGASAFLLSTDLQAPDLQAAVASLSREFSYARTPIVILAGSRDTPAVEQLEAGASHVGRLPAGAGRSELLDRLEEIRTRTGQAPFDETLALDLALEAAAALHRIALDGDTVFDQAAAEAALIAALGADDEELRTRCASVLALLDTPGAQRALVDLALDTANSDSLRIAAFD
ncbi:MAG: HEAT repeat domain-containing protein [Planctomycetota bacterium]|jgi:HEAT repeat protein